MAKFNKQTTLPAIQAQEALASIGYIILTKAMVLTKNPEWRETWDADQATHLLNVAEFCHREGTIDSEQLEIVKENVAPF